MRVWPSWWKSALIKRKDTSAITVSTKWDTGRRQLAVWKPRRETSPETKSAITLLLDFQPSELRKSEFLLLKPEPWPCTSSLQACEEMNFCCLSYPVYGILLWQPKIIHYSALFIFLPNTYYWLTYILVIYSVHY